MSEATPLNTLIRLARHDADQAAKKLQSLNQARRDAEQQLSTLLTYRQDYAERLHQSTQTGMSASNYHNFRQFIATLDEAISQQNRVVAQLDGKLERGRTHWYAEKRRLNSFETLQSRQQKQQSLVERRSEQRINDEISAHQFRRVNSSH